MGQFIVPSHLCRSLGDVLFRFHSSQQLCGQLRLASSSWRCFGVLGSSSVVVLRSCSRTRVAIALSVLLPRCVCSASCATFSNRLWHSVPSMVLGSRWSYRVLGRVEALVQFFALSMLSLMLILVAHRCCAALLQLTCAVALSVPLLSFVATTCAFRFRAVAAQSLGGLRSSSLSLLHRRRFSACRPLGRRAGILAYCC